MTAILFSQMEPPAGWEAEFEEWYDQEHVPARLELAGFTAAARYHAIEGEPWHLAIYDLEDLNALDTPEYTRLKAQQTERTRRMLANARGFTRYVCRLASDTGPTDERPGCLFATTFRVPEDEGAALDEWYEREHVPMLMRADGWLRVRRFRVLPGGDGPDWTHLALHELRSRDVMQAPERLAARDTDWRRSLSERSWFSDSDRWLYAPVAVHAPEPTGRKGRATAPPPPS